MHDSASEEQSVEKALAVRQRVVGWARLYSSPSAVELARAVALQTYQESVGLGRGAVPDNVADHRSCLRTSASAVNNMLRIGHWRHADQPGSGFLLAVGGLPWTLAASVST
jgi:hypothetical protein